MKNSTASNRKTGRMISKNLIILVVLVFVAILAMWAWFAVNEEADASGINVKARGSGVEVSWDGTNYYENLTARTQADADKDTSGKTGLAKSLNDSENNPSPLKLITGDGLNFFEPYLNRRTGTELKNADDTWKGVTINDRNSSARYIDIDLYFRGDSEKNIYLAGDSSVSPKSERNLSAYGDFSKDYICAASRVAFLNADKTRCNFIWAPNANIELKEAKNGYTKVTELKTETISSGVGGGSSIPSGMLMDKANATKSYQFWFPSKYDNDNFSQSSAMRPTKMEFLEVRENDTGKKQGLYVFKYKMNPSARNGSPTFPFIINEVGNELKESDITDYVDRGNSETFNDSKSLIEFSQNGFKVTFPNGSSPDAPALFIKEALLNSTDLQITIGYNPEKKSVIILGYTNENGVIYDEYGVLGGGGTTTVQYYELTDESTTVVLANSDSALAVSSVEANDYKKTISFTSSEKNNIDSSKITVNEKFTATKKGTGYAATYTFKSKDNKYLNIASEGAVSFGDTPTTFTLAYVEGFTGPALRSSDGMYVVFSDGSLTAVSENELNKSDLVTVFTGSGYVLDTNSNVTEDFKFYDNVSKNKELKTLNANSSPPLFTSKTTDNDSTIIGTKSPDNKIAVAKLEKANTTDTYYTAHIVIRIWAEGTDREAKTPLADGIFNTSLHFVSE